MKATANGSFLPWRQETCPWLNDLQFSPDSKNRSIIKWNFLVCRYDENVNRSSFLPQKEAV